jgi:hypothetical protein
LWFYEKIAMGTPVIDPPDDYFIFESYIMWFLIQKQGVLRKIAEESDFVPEANL